jgi:hypothetical protein
VITGPLVPTSMEGDRSWRTPEQAAEVSRRRRITGGIVLIALGILAGAIWIIFVSPYGFSRFSLTDRYRTFSTHQAGTYVVYLESRGASRPQLPPALDVGVSALSGQKVDVRLLGRPGHLGAPYAYDVGSHEGRAIALVTLHHAGAFILTVEPKSGEIDPDQEQVVTDGTVAVGRGWGRGWLTSEWSGALLVVVLVVPGVGLIVSARRSRRGGRELR